MIEAGTTFIVCSHDELIEKGWIFSLSANCYTKHDWPGNSITFDMIKNFAGKTLTVKRDTFQKSWYITEGNQYFWPVAVFLETDMNLNFHVCEEGITPIDGWFICKTCGTNLKEIK